MNPESALLLGASNIYPLLGSTLPSCTTDLKSWYHWYENNYPLKGCPYFAFQNSRFTKKNFFAAARGMLGIPSVKKLAIAESSHGTTIPRNGKNHAAIVFADSTWDDLESFGFDDDFAALANEFPDKHIWMTADACESAMLAFRLANVMGGVNKAIDPPDDLQSMIDHNYAAGEDLKAVVPVLPNVGYISGTGGKGYYSIDEGDGGAFTKRWIKNIDPSWTAQKIATTLDGILDKQQQPQAHGGLASKPWFS